MGHNDGTVTIRLVDEFDKIGQGAKDLNIKLDNIKHVINNPKEWIEAIEYNSDGTRIAVGSHDNKIYVYNVTDDCKYKPFTALKAHSSYITALDWSLDNSYIRSTCGAYELLFFAVDSKK